MSHTDYNSDNEEDYAPSSQVEDDSVTHDNLQEQEQPEVADNVNIIGQNVPNTPLGYFRLLLTNDIPLRIVEEINRNAVEIICSPGVSEHSRISLGKDLMMDELLVFLGVFLHMGNVKISGLEDYWKKDPFFHTKALQIVGAGIGLALILRELHISKNATADENKLLDRLYKIRPITFLVIEGVKYIILGGNFH